MPNDIDTDGIAQRVPANPDVWTDGSLVLDKVSGASSAVSCMYANVSCHAWRHRLSGHLDEIGPVQGSGVGSFRSFLERRERSSLHCKPWMQFMWVWMISM